MGSIGRLAFAKIIKWHKDFTSYDTKSLNLGGISSADNWTLSLFETDIICKVTEFDARRHTELLILTYAIYDDIFKSLKSTLLEKEKLILQHLMDIKLTPEKKKAVKKKTVLRKKKK